PPEEAHDLAMVHALPLSSRLVVYRMRHTEARALSSPVRSRGRCLSKHRQRQWRTVDMLSVLCPDIFMRSGWATCCSPPIDYMTAGQNCPRSVTGPVGDVHV